MIDNTNMFKDFNFKLAVINELLDKKPSFGEALEKLKSEYCNNYEWYLDDSEPITEILEYFSQLLLVNEDLDKITELCFDGGNEIYFIIKPDWQGEDGSFNFYDISGIESLNNLKTIKRISMCPEEILEPLKSKGIVIE